MEENKRETRKTIAIASLVSIKTALPTINPTCQNYYCKIHNNKDWHQTFWLCLKSLDRQTALKMCNVWKHMLWWYNCRYSYFVFAKLHFIQYTDRSQLAVVSSSRDNAAILDFNFDSDFSCSWKDWLSQIIWWSWGWSPRRTESSNDFGCHFSKVSFQKGKFNVGNQSVICSFCSKWSNLVYLEQRKWSIGTICLRKWVKS